MKKLLLLLILISVGCQKNDTPIEISPELMHSNVDKVTEIMIHDIFSPPVASRIFAYPNIAAYEIIAQEDERYLSLAGQVHELSPIPAPDAGKPVNRALAAAIAHIDLSRRLIFSEEQMNTYRDSLYALWSEQNKKEFEASRDYGLEVAEHIAAWMDKDNYKQTRTMPKFTVNTDEPSRWQPTPPAYMAGIEPHWSKIRPFVIDSAEQFKPVPPPPFSMEEGSDFYREVREVYDISKKMEVEGDESEEVEIAKFWDCNPYVSVTRGHLMFATKKITPGAHWIGITKIACRKSNSDFNETVHAYTKTSMAIADAFISCWDEKYRSNLIRPETLINEHIDDNWKPVLQTPPFPEYTSGHSVVSGAASTVLTDIFGENFSFDDDTELAYGLPVRSFTSFRQAADEAAISRMYGGIHYRAAVEVGVKQGRDLGSYIVNTLKTENESQLAQSK
ncbi:PAP2 superfamily protein [Muriicola jejuensis]|uniref:Phosphatase PAP2 family protein n=1 Tax=Muriicola jejuensis TaxID=504488 RepID=A0A6P0UGM0_9FLAO|nr:vanadium-dependent haloperoxidase [Muriicola jejuensis]NER10333.1 phosphatase PAP2 family protein [Muriicola jejuensis]SMP01237.1 PAP2 superfamily protein [Muriicola jejuensis]